MIDPNYEKRACPVCGKCMLSLFDVCEECGWENDPLQHENPDYAGGANQMSLNTARIAYAQHEPIE